jgi:hypothetical protein
MLELDKKTTQVYDQIDNIIQNFDFEKVHKTMKILKWRWVIGRELVIPSVQQLVEKARSLLIEAATKTTSVELGGFKATAKYSEKDILCLRLEFILERYYNETSEITNERN